MDSDPQAWTDDQLRLFGVCQDHYQTMQEWSNKHDTIIILRPSTFETLQRMQDGVYASKSVDVHDKSSDWGPMSGLVTLDPFFSKKHVGRLPITQQLFFDDKIANAKAHSAGQNTDLDAVQLLLPDWKNKKLPLEWNDSEQKPSGVHWG